MTYLSFRLVEIKRYKCLVEVLDTVWFPVLPTMLKTGHRQENDLFVAKPWFTLTIHFLSLRASPTPGLYQEDERHKCWFWKADAIELDISIYTFYQRYQIQAFKCWVVHNRSCFLSFFFFLIFLLWFIGSSYGWLWSDKKQFSISKR